MYPQIVRVGETFLAVFAAEGFLSRVDAAVSDQLISLTEALITLLTGERFFFRVDKLVPPQVTTESLTTLFTSVLILPVFVIRSISTCAGRVQALASSRFVGFISFSLAGRRAGSMNGRRFTHFLV